VAAQLLCTGEFTNTKLQHGVYAELRAAHNAYRRLVKERTRITNLVKGTRLHQKGVGPFTIKDLAGHKSLNTTMRYIRNENKEQAEAVDRLEFGTMDLWYNDSKIHKGQGLSNGEGRRLS